MSAIATLKLSNMRSTKAQTPSPSKDTSLQKATQKVTKIFSLQDINIGASETCLGTAKTTQKPCKHSIPKERRDAAKILEKELSLATATKHVRKQPKKEEEAEYKFVVIDEELGALLISMARISLCHNHKEQLRNVVDVWTKIIELQQPVEEAQISTVPGKDLAVNKEEEVKDGEEAKPQVKIAEEGESDKKGEKPEVKIEESVADSKPSIFGGWTFSEDC